ncbi:hypothetical protein [Streptomyces sp. NBC_00059]|uniref:hypothetical protein n=1 Tax=Streptomyces sp. NBC_00059 TaxID=2975635 RepID=UPI0022527F44|nr:hypothetical protein [Streptomyces sp. NBC_00059]MCX5410546.1 hypothetical protein [Streptomyces sp. NBC_00059]
MTSTLTLRALGKLRTAPGGQLDCQVIFADGPGTSRPVAHVERELPPGGIPVYLAARKSGARSFVLWADEHRQARAATLVTVSASGGRAQFQVLGGQGEHLGVITRDKAFSRGLRTRWTVTPAGGTDAVGYKGRLFWWCVWWPFTLFLPIMLVALVFGGGGGGGDFPRGPRRIKWRSGGKVPLEFKSSGNTVRLYAPELDWRLGAALTALIPTFDGWIGTPWDARKD